MRIFRLCLQAVVSPLRELRRAEPAGGQQWRSRQRRRQPDETHPAAHAASPTARSTLGERARRPMPCASSTGTSASWCGHDVPVRLAPASPSHSAARSELPGQGKIGESPLTSTCAGAWARRSSRMPSSISGRCTARRRRHDHTGHCRLEKCSDHASCGSHGRCRSDTCAHRSAFIDNADVAVQS